MNYYVSMMSLIDEKFLGKKSIIRNEKFELPKFELVYLPMDVLEMIVGKKEGFDPKMLSTSIKKWFSVINSSIYIPILGFLATTKFDMSSIDWWDSFLDCSGHLLFLKKNTALFGTRTSCPMTKIKKKEGDFDSDSDSDSDLDLDDEVYSGKFNTKKIISDIANLCAKKGHLETLGWINVNIKGCNLVSAFNAACVNKQLDCAVYCILHGNIKFKLVEESIGKNGFIELAKYYLGSTKEVICRYLPEKLRDVVSIIVKYENEYEIDLYYIILDSCSSGNFECAKWALSEMSDEERKDFLDIEEYDNGGIQQALDNACYSGNFDIINWCKLKGATSYTNGLYTACYNGHLDIAKWCVKNGKLTNPEEEFDSPLYAACDNGKIICAEYCIKMGATNFDYALEGACKNHHIDCVILCVKHGANTNTYDFNYFISQYGEDLRRDIYSLAGIN